MPPHITRTILEETSIDFYTDYGLNEAPRVTFLRYRDYPDQLESVGFANEGVDVFLVDRDGNRVRESRQQGEICIAGPQVISGYLGDASTERAVQDGVLHTGDTLGAVEVLAGDVTARLALA